MPFRAKNILLFNPWIYDFAAYDFWNKPLGLLNIGSVLRRHGYDVQLIDCLDRFHPAMADFKPLKNKEDGTGKFYREEIDKPDVLKNVPRKYCRYGMPPEIVLKILESRPRPDAVFVTSFMTYWYTGVRDAVKLLRTIYPQVPIFLGGIYATLMSAHALAEMKPDCLICGEGEKLALEKLAAFFGQNNHTFTDSLVDDFISPAYDLYPTLKSIALMTSRGCPFRCSFCASFRTTARYRRFDPEQVFQEIKTWWEKYAVQHVAFFDDALLLQSNRCLRPLLRKMIANGLGVHLHAPNGMHVKQIDEEIANLMFEAQVKTINLSFESSDRRRQQSMNAKVTNSALEIALTHLENAGYKRPDIGVFVLMGLPDQEPEEVRASVRFVTELGAKVNLASFSPIPGTLEWEKSRQLGYTQFLKDPLLTNNTIFPLWSEKYSYALCDDLAGCVKEQNKKLSLTALELL
jgi:radical SAM superfamily enzyme YgiQ (UPF0313 family)